MELSGFQAHHNNKDPLYLQLYRYIIAQMIAGELTGGEKLPSKRTIAAQLGVSLNTVDAACQMLVAEGYVESKPRSGYFVCRIDQPISHAPAPLVPAAALSPAPSWRYDFRTSGVDVSLFPYKTWARIQREILTAHPDYLNLGDREGDSALRTAIAGYLHEYRGVRCTPDRIVVGAGIEYLVSLLANLFCDATFALENPGYERVRQVLRNNRVLTVFVPVDRSGIDVDALAASSADVAYVTPSHQFPTGAILPMARRQELLGWANGKPGRYIIEDDYDSEFRFDTRPIPALQGLDGAGRVIYIGTFSRIIAPSIRIAYMVLPDHLVELFRTRFAAYSPTVSRFEQHTLSRFITSGAFSRHLNRTRVAYRARRDLLARSLTAAIGADRLTLHGAHTGLHLLARINGLSESALVSSALAAGIRVRGLSEFYFQSPADCPPSTVVLGYSALDEMEIGAACALLGDIWHQL